MSGLDQLLQNDLKRFEANYCISIKFMHEFSKFKLMYCRSFNFNSFNFLSFNFSFNFNVQKKWPIRPGLQIRHHLNFVRSTLKHVKRQPQKLNCLRKGPGRNLEKV